MTKLTLNGKRRTNALVSITNPITKNLRGLMDRFEVKTELSAIRDGPLVFYWVGGGGTFFVKKLFASCSSLKNLSSSRLRIEKIVCKAKEIFWNTLIF